MNSPRSNHTSAITTYNVGLALSSRAQWPSITMNLLNKVIEGLGHEESCAGTTKFFNDGSKFNTGLRIACAVGVVSSVGAPILGSLPRFTWGELAAGLTPGLAVAEAAAVPEAGVTA